MATQVDERVVSMQFNNSQFESSASTTLNTLDRLKEALNFSGADRGFENITTAANSVNLSGLGTAVDSIRVKFSTLEAVALSVMNNLVTRAMSVGESIIRSLTISPIMDGFNEYETKIRSIQTIMANVNNSTQRTASGAAGGITQTAEEAKKSAAAANKQAQKDLKAAQKAETKAFNKQAEAELKEFNKAAQEELEVTKEAQNEQLETLADAHEEELKELQKSQKEELKELKNGYTEQLEALNDEMDAELDAVQQAHKEKLQLYEEEYLAKVKSIDEERYNELKAIQDQIDALNDLTEAENKARKEAAQQEKLNTLKELAEKARSAKRKEDTAKDLADYEAELAEERAQQERKDQIELLKDQMDNIKEVYQEKLDTAKEEYSERRELENNSYTDSAAGIIEYYAELKTAAQQSYSDQLEALQEQQEARREMINEQYQAERKLLQDQLSDELEAIRERQNEEKEAIQDRQSEERDALNERHSDELDAISSSSSAALSAVSGVTSEALNGVDSVNKAIKEVTLEDVNRALEELNEYADKTIYNFGDMTDNIGKFVSAGVGLDDSVAAIKGFSNVAALSGSTAQKTSNAMYQLSQAISAGTVKLEDWRSLERADVNSVQFRESLMETARVHGIAIDDIIAKEGSFRDSLSTGWLSSDIMVETLRKFTGDLSDEELAAMGYTEDQIKLIQEQAKNAVEAATKVRTWTQLIGTMREAVGSGWAKTFELIFGDFNEATNLWTNLNDVFSTMIDNQAEKRNQLLEDWKSAGGRQMLLTGLQHVWEALLPIIQAVRDGIRDIFPETTSKKLTLLTSKFMTFTLKLGASTTLIENIRKTFRGIASVFSLVGDAVKSFLKVFAPSGKTINSFAEAVFSVTGRIGDMITNFSRAVKEGKGFETFFNGVKTAITTTVGAIATFISKAVELVKTITTPIANTFIDKFKESVAGGEGSISAVFASITGVVASFKDNWKESFDSLGDLGAAGVVALQTGVEKIKDKIDTFGEWITEATSGVRAAVVGFFTANEQAVSDGKSKIQNVLSTAWEFIKGIFSNLKNLPALITTIGGTLGKTIGEFIHGIIDSLSLGDIFKTVTTVESIGILDGIRKIIGGFGDMLHGGGSIFESLSKGFTRVSKSVADAVEGFNKTDTAEIIKEVGKAMAILALSMLAISTIDDEKIKMVLGSFSAAMLELVVAVGALNKVGSKNTKIDKNGISIGGSNASAIMKSLAMSMLEFSAAMKILSTIDYDKMDEVLLASVGFAAEAILAVAALNKVSEKSKGSDLKGLKTFSKSLVTFAIAMRIIGGMDYDGWKLAMEAIAAFSGEASVSVSLMSAFSKKAEDGGDLKGLDKFGNAIIKFAISMRIIGAMDWEAWEKAMEAIALFAAEAAGCVTLMSIFSKSAEEGGDLKGLETFGNAIIKFAISMRIIGAMEWDDWKKAMIAIAAFCVEAIIVVKKLNKFSKSASQSADYSGLTTFAESIILFAVAMRIIGGMDWEGIAKSLVGLGVAAGIMVGVMFLLTKISETKGFDDRNLNAMCDGMIKLAAAMLILTPALLGLSILDPSGLATALIALAGALGIFTAEAFAIDQLNLGPTIDKLGKSIALFGLGIAGVGVGLVAFSLGLAALAATGSGVVASFLVTMSGIVNGILDMIIEAIPKIGEVISTLIQTICTVILDNANTLVSTFLQLILTTLEQIKEQAPTIVNTVADIILEVLEVLRERVPEIVKQVMGLVGDIIVAVLDEIKNIDFSAYMKGIEGVGLLSALVAVVAGVSPLIGPAAAGLAEMALLVGELTALLVAMGAINEIPGVDWLINEGIYLLEKIGTAIGKFFGSIVGGAVEGFVDRLPRIGTRLSKFMDNAGDFFDGIKGFSSDTANAVKYLAEAILIITGADILDSIKQFFGGGESSLAAFGKELAEFGPEFAKYAGAVKDVNPETVEASANAAKTLAEMAKALPNEGGKLAEWLGDNTLSQFANELKDFGPILMKYAQSVEGLKADVVENSTNAAKSITAFAKTIPNEGGKLADLMGDNTLSRFAEELKLFGPALMYYSLSVFGLKKDVVENSANAATAISKFAKTIPNSGGILADLMGDNTLSGFAKELKEFGPALKYYADSVDGMSAGKVTASTFAAKALAGVMTALPDTGGLSSLIFGDKDISNFAADLPNLGKKIKKFADNVDGMDAASVTESATAAKALAAVNDALPDSGGVKGFLFGDQDLGDFGDNLADLGKGIKGYYDEIAEINTEKLTASVDSVQVIVDMANGINGLDFVSLTNFTTNIQNMAKNGISAFTDEFEGSESDVKDAITTMIGFANAKLIGSVLDVKDAAEAIGASVAAFFKSGLGTGEGEETTKNAITEFINTITEGITTNLDENEFLSAGNDIVLNLASGITAKGSFIQRIVENMCKNDIIEKMDDSLPDKKFDTIAKDVMTALRNGLSFHSSLVKTEIGTQCTKFVNLFRDDLPLSEFVAIGKKICTGLSNGIGNNTRTVISSADGLTSSIRTAVSDGLSYGTFSSMGSNIVDGLTGGINNAKERAVSAARELAQAVESEMNSALDINSPSKVTRAIGQFVGIGLALGITDEVTRVKRASTDFTERALDPVSEAISRISDSMGDIGSDFQPTITPVIDLRNVDQAAGYISSSFAGLGSIGMSSALAQSVSGGFNRMQYGRQAESDQRVKSLEDKLDTLGNAFANDTRKTENVNTFYIRSTDPKQAAEEVSYIMQHQVERRRAVWAK